jgi:hypothetical protein
VTSARPGLALAFAAVLLAVAFRAGADCKPAAPDAIADADRKAQEAEHKADLAESVAVRSGNPGAAKRADIARREALDARKRAAELACKPPPAGASPAPKPATGY